jgi:hypothetical protein
LEVEIMDKTGMIDYLTKEIETLSTNTMNARNRISFSLLIGPFLVFGSILLSNQRSGVSLSIHTRSAWIALAVAALAFLGLSLTAGLVERGAWKKCNEWRRCIVKLQEGEAITGAQLEALILYKAMVHKVALVYPLVFLIILVIFGATSYVAAELVRAG